MTTPAVLTTTPATESTQLYDEFPQIDVPLRVMQPQPMSVPPRINPMTKDEFIRHTAYSPEAFMLRANLSNTNQKVATQAKRQNEANKREFSENHAAFRTKISDYNTLAFSMRRAGNVQAEAAAHFCVGLTQDNMGKLPAAMTSYKKFLTLSQQINDSVGEALAYNCMGVNQMNVACPLNEGSPYDSGISLKEEPGAVTALKAAIEYHMKHSNISDDGGQFVANTNLALCHSLLNDFVTAAKFHQDALRIAIRMQSFSGQCVAVGNLGLLSMRQNDLTTAKACLEQHLQLTQSLKDSTAECAAWTLLGNIANTESDFDQAVHYYEQGRKIATNSNMRGFVKRLNTLLGISIGSKELAGKFDTLKQQLG